jgi:DnaJ-class molecular chaperone
MPFCVEFDPAIHCPRCRGWGTIQFLGAREEVPCGLCFGSGMKRGESVA